MIRKRRRKRRLSLEEERRNQVLLLVIGAVIAAVVAGALPTSCNRPLDPGFDPEIRERLEDLAHQPETGRR